MRKQTRWILGLAAAAVGLLFVLSVTARLDRESAPSRAQTPTEVDPATGAVLVDVADDASDDDLRAVGRELRQAIAPFAWPSGRAGLGLEIEDDANLFRLRPPASEVADVVRALSHDPRVEVVEVERSWAIPESERSFAVSSPAPAPNDAPDRFVPNDPYYAYQWHLDRIGMPQAWTRNRGTGAVVAVIDTGVAYRSEGGFMQAPDLGDTRFVEGYDFVRNDAHPDDEHGHGTHVSGTIAQSTNNGVGVAGVAPEATIMPLKVLDASGRGGWRRYRGGHPLRGRPRRERHQHVARWRDVVEDCPAGHRLCP